MTRLGIRRRFYCFLFHNPELRDELFATSYVVPQRMLAGIRSTLFIYCLAVLISNLAVNVAHGAGWNWAAYFTTLTFFGITLYYGFASYTTIAYAWKQQKIRTDGAAALVDSESASQSPPLSDIGEGYIKNSMPREIAQTQPPSLAHQVALASQWILYESFTCFAPLVSLIYWALLFPTQDDILDSGLDTWMGVSMHALNSVLMLCEVGVFAKTPYRYSHFWILFVFLALYLALAYFMVGVYGFYVYPFFDSRYFGGYIALICLLIIDIIAVVWVIMLMVHRLRDEIYPRWLLKRQRSTVF